MSQQRKEQYKDKNIERAAQELDGYRSRQQQILRLKERKLNLEAEMCGIKAMRYDDIKVQGGPARDDILEKVYRWAKIDDEIYKLVIKNEHETYIIEEKIRRLKYDENQVIVYYYLNGKNITDTANAMNMSFEGIKKLKKRALRAYANIEL